MKKAIIFMLTAIVLAACSSDEEQNESTTVTINFSPYDVEPMTRAAVSIADVVTRLEVWITDGTTTTDLHQSSSDVGFGSLAVTLDKTKTYTLYAVAHKADGATLSDGVISFTDDKVTHSMFYTTTFSPATTTNLSCLMNRIVAQFRIETTDAVPAAAKKIQITINDVFDRWNVSSGGTHSLNRSSTVNITSTANDGTVAINVFAIVTDAQTMHTVTVEALDENDAVIQSRVFENVPLRNGYKTNYRGTFFIDTPATAGFTIDDWNEYDVVDF